MRAINKQDSVTARRAIIIMGTGYLPILVSEPNEIHHLVMILHSHLHQSLKHHSIVHLLQTHPLGLLQRIEQVYQFLVVYLKN